MWRQVYFARMFLYSQVEKDVKWTFNTVFQIDAELFS